MAPFDRRSHSVGPPWSDDVVDIINSRLGDTGRDIDTDDRVTGHGASSVPPSSPVPTLHHRRSALYTGSWWVLGNSSASTFRAAGRSSNRITVTDVLGTQRPFGRPR